jgi:Flp pilus assembly protein TadD
VNSNLDDVLQAFQRGDLGLARELAEQQLTLEADSPQLQHLLGLVECRSGRLDAGVEWLRRASDAAPANVQFRVMLARALVDSGRAAEALDTAQKPAGVSPAELALWHARAEAAGAIEDWVAAADAWAVLTSARRDDWRAWSNHAEALAKIDRWEEATAALRRAAQLNPGESRILRNLASALAHIGAYDECAAVLERLITEEPDDPKLRILLARVLADLGRTEESMDQFEQAARLTIGASAAADDDGALIHVALPERRPGDQLGEADIESIRELALLLERTNRIDALRDLLGQAESFGITREQLGFPAAAIALRDGQPAEAKRLLALESPERDPTRWHRLMAKIADAVGDCAGAFAEAEIMNGAVRNHDDWRQRGRDYRRQLRGLGTQLPRRLPTIQPGQRRSPAFLVGFPRSGTTLADTFLMGHSGTRILEEVHLLGAAEETLGGLPKLADATTEQLGMARDVYFAELDRHVEPGFSGLIIDKLPLNMLGLPFIFSIFPDAKVIFAQRHPCDAVLSGFMQSFVLNPAMACFLDLADAADLYDAAMNLFCLGRERTALDVHTLVYEHLIEDPEASLRAVVSFLRLEWRPELLDHRATAKKRGAIITPSYDQVIQPLSKEPSGRWRRYEKQLAPVLPVLLPWAEHLGYRD